MKPFLQIQFFLLAHCFYTGNHIYAQQPLNQIKIVNFTVKNKLPTDISNWDKNQSNVLLTAQKLPQVQLQNVKLVVQLKLAGTKLCGNTAQSAIAMDAFSIRNFSASEFISLLPQCTNLASNSYTICVQFFNVDNYPISKEICKDFEVGETIQTFSAPQNYAPTNEKKFAAAAIKVPITFKWSPVTPKLKVSILYKLRVWQLLQGQTDAEAIKINSPIVEKEINNLTHLVVSNIFDNTCKPPYLCRFVWNVQALDKEAKPIGSNDGVSELYAFSLKQNEWEHIKLLMPENKKVYYLDSAENEMIFKWTAFKPKPNNPVVYKLRVWQLLQGQNSIHAFKNNKPIITKYIENIEMVNMKKIISSKCLPPFSCNFIWTVQALGADGNPLDDKNYNLNDFSIQ